MSSTTQEHYLKYQCCRCAATYDKRQRKCTDCGCPSLREVISEEELDCVSVDSVAHFKKKLEHCLNYRIDKRRPADKIFHPLKLVRDVNKDQSNMVLIIERCAECNLKYSIHAIPRTRTDVLEKLGVKL